MGSDTSHKRHNSIYTSIGSSLSEKKGAKFSNSLFYLEKFIIFEAWNKKHEWSKRLSNNPLSSLLAYVRVMKRLDLFRGFFVYIKNITTFAHLFFRFG